MSEGDSAQSRAPQGAGQPTRGFQKGPKASHSLPDTGASPPPGPAWRQLSSTRGRPHSQRPSSSGSCHRRPAPGPPRSIHNLRPRPWQAVRRPPAALRTRRGAARGLGSGTEAPRRRGSAPSPETAMHHGRGVGASRRRRRRRPPAARPPRTPARTRPLAPTAAADSAERPATA